MNFISIQIDLFQKLCFPILKGTEKERPFLLSGTRNGMRSFFYSVNVERNAFRFFDNERGTERVPEIRGTTIALQ